MKVCWPGIKTKQVWLSTVAW